MNKLFAVCSFLVASSFAIAQAHQGSVSYACGTNEIVQFNLEGQTFTPQTLAEQGYVVNVVGDLLKLVRGSESIVVGSLQAAGECSYTFGTVTRFVSFTNANLLIAKEEKDLTGCFEVTSDGMWGIKRAVTINLVGLDNGFTMQLQQTITNIIVDQDRCEAEHSGAQ